jgi:hypothetical protein
MKFNKWTLALAAMGVVSLGSLAQAEEAKSQVLTAVSSTTLSGYVDTSAIWKFGTGNTLVGRSFDGTAKQDGFNLNVVKLSVGKALDEGQWSAGYQADLLFGPDAAAFNSFGTGENMAIQQAYVVMRAPAGNGLDIKMGVFNGVLGYESFDSYKNPNFSRSLGFALEPLQHTGVLASYQVAEWLSVSAGVANTVQGAINSRAVRGDGTFFGFNAADETEKTYMGSFVLTAPESMGVLKGASLYGGFVDGLGSAQGPTLNGFYSPSDITYFYAGVTVPTPIEALAFGASYDYRGTKNKDISGVTAGASYANASALYVTYQATEKLKLANRFEYATGSDGTWYTSAELTDRNNALLAETVTLDYALWANVVTRLEFRWDHYIAGAPVHAQPWGGYPYGSGPNDGDQNALSVALNVIYRF